MATCVVSDFLVCSVRLAILELPQPKSGQLHLHATIHQAVGGFKVAVGPQGTPVKEQHALQGDDDQVTQGRCHGTGRRNR